MTAATRAPAPRYLSLGAGVQSTTLFILAADGHIPPIDAAIFADTGAEPAAVYRHLDRIENEAAKPAGIPIYRVSVGNIIAGSLGLADDGDHILSRPAGWFASMPLYVQSEPAPCETCEATGYVKDDDGTPSDRPKRCRRCSGTGIDPGRGMLPRQCTADYKLAAVKAKTRELLTGSADGRVPKGVYAETLIGFSAEEVMRIKDSDVQYQRLSFPLIYDMRMTRADCRRWLERRGWGDTPRSACVICSLHGNRMWREMRDQRPDEWTMAVAFDHALREHSVYTHGAAAINGTVYLHSSRLPLDQAPIDKVTRGEWRGSQPNLFDVVVDDELENGDPDGCSPWACRSGSPIPEVRAA